MPGGGVTSRRARNCGIKIRSTGNEDSRFKTKCAFTQPESKDDRHYSTRET